MPEFLDGVELKKGFGVTPLEEVRKLTGLEFLQGIVAGDFPAPTMGGTLGFRLYEVGDGFANFTGVPGEKHFNPAGVVHGGYAATLLDSALGCACHTLSPRGHSNTTIELKVNLVRPIMPQVGRLYAKAKVIHPGRQISTAEGQLVDEAGKLYAHGTTTCLTFKLPE
ncbi:MAG: PaaI family thioesterase [Ahrensia sp.]|nr:PaaI family thioesterase [Ahrensia sp.]